MPNSGLRPSWRRRPRAQVAALPRPDHQLPAALAGRLRAASRRRDPCRSDDHNSGPLIRIRRNDRLAMMSVTSLKIPTSGTLATPTSSRRPTLPPFFSISSPPQVDTCACKGGAATFIDWDRYSVRLHQRPTPTGSSGCRRAKPGGERKKGRFRPGWILLPGWPGVEIHQYHTIKRAEFKPHFLPARTPQKGIRP